MLKSDNFKWHIELIRIAITIGTILVTMIWFFARQNTDISLIQKDINTINTNHLTHLQNYAEEIKKLDEKDTKQDEQIIEMNNTMGKVLILLEQHVKDSKTYFQNQ